MVSSARLAASRRSLACAIGAGILQPSEPVPPAGFSFVTTNSNADFVTSGGDRVIARAA